MTCSTLTSALPGSALSIASISLPLGSQHVEVVAEQLDGQVGPAAGDHLVDPHLDRLRDTPAAGPACRADASRSASVSSACVSAFFHCVARLERDEHVGQLDAHRVGGDLGACRSGSRRAATSSGNAARSGLLHLRVVLDRLLQVGAGSRTMLMAIAPSDSRGTNSEPRFGAIMPNATTSTQRRERRSRAALWCIENRRIGA